MVLNLGIGLYTPPHRHDALHIIVHCEVVARRHHAGTRPFFIVAMLVLLAVSYIPALTIY